jgi:hypothetical protein
VFEGVVENKAVKECGEFIEAKRLAVKLIELNSQLVVAFMKSFNVNCELNKFMRLLVLLV